MTITTDYKLQRRGVVHCQCSSSRTSLNSTTSSPVSIQTHAMHPRPCVRKKTQVKYKVRKKRRKLLNQKTKIRKRKSRNWRNCVRKRNDRTDSIFHATNAKRQPIGMLCRSSDNHDYHRNRLRFSFTRIASNACNASACVACVWMETGL